VAPPLFNAIVDDDPRHLRGLRQLLAGGEALSVPHVRRALDALRDIDLINGYGPTECTTFTATYRVPRDLDPAARSIPIGRPIDGRLHLNGARPVPAGIVGNCAAAADSRRVARPSCTAAFTTPRRSPGGSTGRAATFPTAASVIAATAGEDLGPIETAIEARSAAIAARLCRDRPQRPAGGPRWSVTCPRTDL
jgi:non-ribosomal peptide synthetase component F